MEHRKHMEGLVFVAAAATAFGLVACASNSDDGDPSARAATSPTATSSSDAAGGDTSTANPGTATSATAGDANASDTPITINARGRTITATLNNSDVSRDFIETLPATLPWFRNASIEYITELEAPMTETGPFYTDVQPGDLVYYNPMDSITKIFEETSSVPTLTKMAEITSDLTVFENLPDKVEMRIELR